MKPASTSAAVMPVWKASPDTCHIRTASSATIDSGGMMNGGMRSSPGPHCHAARNTISSATLAAVPFHTTEEFDASLMPAPSRDVEPVHQPVDVVVDLRMGAALERIVAVGNVDRDLVDDAAGTPAHHQHAVGQRHGLQQIVGDQQRGLAGALERLRQFALQHHAGLRVDRRERLVEQQHRRIDRERARQRHALPHAAGQLVRIVPGEFRELEVFQQRLRAPPRSAAATPWISTPNITFSATVRHGSSRSFCSMKATWAFGPSTRSPSTKAWPSLGAVSPEPMLSKVDLPQPLGPISDTTSPSRTAMLTPCTAVRWPAALRETHRDVAVFQPYHVRHRIAFNRKCCAHGLCGLLHAYSRPRLSSIVANQCAECPSAL